MGERQARACKASIQARQLPLKVTQLWLGSPDRVYPLENGGQREGKRVGLEYWDFGGSQCYQYLQA